MNLWFQGMWTSAKRRSYKTVIAYFDRTNLPLNIPQSISCYWHSGRKLGILSNSIV